MLSLNKSHWCPLLAWGVAASHTSCTLWWFTLLSKWNIALSLRLRRLQICHLSCHRASAHRTSTVCVIGFRFRNKWTLLKSHARLFPQNKLHDCLGSIHFRLALQKGFSNSVQIRFWQTRSTHALPYLETTCSSKLTKPIISGSSCSYKVCLCEMQDTIPFCCSRHFCNKMSPSYKSGEHNPTLLTNCLVFL